ncbi:MULTISPECIES: hypothetical protein [Acidianus]|uniref:Uncharacterized protein n=1 Tax=Candidatus Acidianus copahuensis TaxID=1160895 RepID=A0A031LND9_9CREN|nr:MULTISPECIES: hypothetical protein [Acidianus]EZQ04930.1 hypothetical protein CM19_08165 [Candidatus Acidianus copahuensis]NON63467.1 hypothetical protein [Acidianus sp. RZ1]
MPRELTPIEQLQLLLPGYRGYKAKDLIRQDDFLIRRSVADKIEQAISAISMKESILASTQPFSPQLKVMEFILSNLRSLETEIMSSQGGGGDIYARWKINTEELDQIVNHDLNMIQIAQKIADLANSDQYEQIPPQIQSLKSLYYERKSLFFPPEYR